MICAGKFKILDFDVVLRLNTLNSIPGNSGRLYFTSSLTLFGRYVWLILMFNIESHSSGSDKHPELRPEADTQASDAHPATQFVRQYEPDELRVPLIKSSSSDTTTEGSESDDLEAGQHEEAKDYDSDDPMTEYEDGLEQPVELDSLASVAPPPSQWVRR